MDANNEEVVTEVTVSLQRKNSVPVGRRHATVQSSDLMALLEITYLAIGGLFRDVLECISTFKRKTSSLHLNSLLQIRQFAVEHNLLEAQSEVAQLSKR